MRRLDKVIAYLADFTAPVVEAVASIFFVLPRVPKGLRGPKALLYLVPVSVLIFLGHAWFLVQTGESLPDSLSWNVGCLVFQVEDKCANRAASATATAELVVPSSDRTSSAGSATDAGKLCQDEYEKYAQSRHAHEATTIYIFDRGPIDYNRAIYDEVVASCDAIIARGGTGLARTDYANILYYTAVLLLAPNPTAANPDMSRIVELMSLSADNGNAAAAYDVGNVYWFGTSEIQSPKLAQKYLELAAVAGLPSGMLHLGSFYEAGPEAYRDYTKACDWYQRAGEANTPAGRMAIGACYAFGRGRPQNYTAALAWYKRPAEEGWPEAQMMMGFISCDAPPPIRDRDQCRTWLQKAARSGFQGAEETALMYGISLVD